jgi:hypothetical protein
MHFDPDLVGAERARKLLGNQYKVRLAPYKGPEQTRRPTYHSDGGDEDLVRNPDVTPIHPRSTPFSPPFCGINHPPRLEYTDGTLAVDIFTDGCRHRVAATVSIETMFSVQSIFEGVLYHHLKLIVREPSLRARHYPTET